MFRVKNKMILKISCLLFFGSTLLSYQDSMDHNRFMRESITYFVSRLFDLEEKDFEMHIAKVRSLARQNQLDEKKALHALISLIEQKIAYHGQRIGKKRDNSYLKWAIGLSASSIVAFRLIYAGYHKWHKPRLDEIERICGWHSHHYISAAYAGDRFYAKDYRDKEARHLVSLLDDIGLMFKVEIMLGFLAAVPWIPVPGCLYLWLNPQDKERHEKYILIRDKLKNSLKIPR